MAYYIHIPKTLKTYTRNAENAHDALMKIANQYHWTHDATHICGEKYSEIYFRTKTSGRFIAIAITDPRHLEYAW